MCRVSKTIAFVTVQTKVEPIIVQSSCLDTEVNERWNDTPLLTGRKGFHSFLSLQPISKVANVFVVHLSMFYIRLAPFLSFLFNNLFYCTCMHMRVFCL